MFWKFTAIIDVDEQVRGCGCALEEEPIGRGLAYTSLQYYKVFFATCMANARSSLSICLTDHYTAFFGADNQSKAAALDTGSVHWPYGLDPLSLAWTGEALPALLPKRSLPS